MKNMKKPVASVVVHCGGGRAAARLVSESIETRGKYVGVCSEGGNRRYCSLNLDYGSCRAGLLNRPNFGWSRDAQTASVCPVLTR